MHGMRQTVEMRLNERKWKFKGKIRKQSNERKLSEKGLTI